MNPPSPDQRLLRQGAYFCCSIAVFLLAVLWSALRIPGSTSSARASAKADELATPVLAGDGIVLPRIGHLDRGCVAFWDRIPTGELVAGASKQNSIRECCRACRSARCNAYIYCNQEEGCHTPPQQHVAGNLSSLAFQGCLLLYQGLSDAKTGRPVLAVHASGFIGGAPITATAMLVKGYAARVGNGFFNRFNYICTHPGRLAETACILRGTPEELAPLCDADPKCRVMVHMQNGWDYLGMNVTELKGGEGVDMNASVASLNNNVASYFKLAPPPPRPSSSTTSKALIAGVAVGACLGAALMAAVAAVVVRRGQSAASPHATAAAAAAAAAANAVPAGPPPSAAEIEAMDLAVWPPSQGFHDSARTIPHKSPISSLGGSQAATSVAEQKVVGQQSQRQQHQVEQLGQKGPLSTETSASRRTKVPPWLNPLQPAAPGMAAGGSGPAALGLRAVALSGGNVPSPFEADAYGVSSPFEVSSQSPFSRGAQVDASSPTAACAAGPGAPPMQRSSTEPALPSPTSGGSGGSHGVVLLEGGELKPGSSKGGSMPLPAFGNAPVAAVAGSVPAREARSGMGGQRRAVEPGGGNSSAGGSGGTDSAETQLESQGRSGAGGSEGGPVLGKVVRARQQQPGDSLTKSWEEEVDVLQASGSAGRGSTLGSAEEGSSPYSPATAEQLLARLPEVHWQDWVVDPSELEFACRPDGRYVQLGTGGFGTVYRVMLDGVQPYAGKVVEIGVVPEVQNTFLREASMLRRLRHRNIVGFRGLCISGGRGILLMELMEGGDLFSKIHAVNKAMQQRTFGWWARGKRVALDVARGIHYLHSLHLTHLDVKSSNVLLTRDLTAKLADVGFTRLMSHTHHSVRGSQTGTFDYMAPELLMGRPCNHSVDIYSFGVLLWEICSGEHPHRGRNISRGLRVPQDCPQGVADLCDQCMSQDPDTRPTARQLVEQITELAAPTGAADR